MGSASAVEVNSAKRKEDLKTVLCKFLSIDSFLDPSTKAHLEWPDLQSICMSLVTSSKKESILGISSQEQEEVCRWLAYADSFHLDSNSSLSKLKTFNEILSQRSVLTGKGLCLSLPDVVVWTSLHDVVIGLSGDDRRSVPNLMRWFDYIQNKQDFSPMFEKIHVGKPEFGPKKFLGKLLLPGEDGVNSTTVGFDMNMTTGTKKNTEKEEDKPSAVDETVKIGATEIGKKDTVQKKENIKEKKKAKEENMKIQENEPIEKKEIQVSVSILNIRVGVIRKAWKHPSAESLLVEEIDLGEEKVRQVVSGLAKHYGADDLLNRRVLVVTNVKPGKLRDVMSAGLVLCASSDDHSIVEPLLPPEDAKIGERITFAGHEGKPEDVLNPKKKQLEKITPHFYTDDKGVATYKGVPFMTNVGFCFSSLSNAGIK